jgi:hypothetical protein
MVCFSGTLFDGYLNLYEWGRFHVVHADFSLERDQFRKEQEAFTKEQDRQSTEQNQANHHRDFLPAIWAQASPSGTEPGKRRRRPSDG